MKIVVLCIAIAFVAAHVKTSKETPPLTITNGVEVIPYSIPYQARIIVDDGDWVVEPGCGGILITSKYVLTAAQCVKGHHKIEVILGAHNITKKETTQVKLKGIATIIPPGYKSSTYANDIALIELECPIHPTEAIGFAKLPKKVDGVSLKGRYGTVSGWGVTKNGYDSLENSEVLMETVGTIMDNNSCELVYSNITSRQICMSGLYGRGACAGDVGGPLEIDGIVYGIVSHGSRDCVFGYPTVFTRIDSYLTWIQYNSDWTS